MTQKGERMQTQTVSFQVPIEFTEEFKNMLHVLSKSMKFEIKELHEKKEQKQEEQGEERLKKFKDLFGHLKVSKRPTKEDLESARMSRYAK